MPTPHDHPITCPVLVGRSADYAALAQLLELARAGRAQLALIDGDAGVGKSRLIAELKLRAAQEGFHILQGQCFETDRVLPYAPLLDLLRGEMAARAPGAQAELSHLLAELSAGLPTGAALGPAPAQLRRRLFERLSQLLLTATPALLVVEDLHWCDDASLEFLLFLVRRSAGQRLMLVLSYRADADHSALAALLAELNRERLARELTLDRLTRAETEAFIIAYFGLHEPIQPDFLAAIYALTEGNPFFVEELLKSLIASGEIYFAAGKWGRKPLAELHIPRSVLVAVQRRLDLLDPEAQLLLRLAAVAGRRFDFALLQELTQHDEAALLQLIKQTIHAQLVREEAADTFTFRHALTQQAVLADMLARERRALHRAVAEAMERIYAPVVEARLADLAYHFAESEAWERALEYAQRAGEHARHLYAPRAAIEQDCRAIHAAGQLGRGLPELYRRRGQMYQMLGEFAEARADYEQALQLARAAHDRLEQWRSLFDLGFLWTGRDHEQAGRYLRQALEAARALGDQPLYARSLNRMGNWYANVEQPANGQRYHEQALAIFQELGDRAGLAETIDLLAGASMLSGSLAAAMSLYEQASALFRALDDRMGLVSSLSWLAFRGATSLNTMVATAPLDACARTAEEALALAQAIGWRSGEAFAMIALGFCQGAQGYYARALELTRGGLAIAQEIEHALPLSAAHVAFGALYLDMLAPPLARSCLEAGLDIVQQSNARFSIYLHTSQLATAYVRQGELGLATALLDRALGTQPAGEALAPTMAQRLCWIARAELLLAGGSPAPALQIVDQLIETAGTGGTIAASLPLMRGAALAALGRHAEAEAAMRQALHAAETQGARPQVWRSHAALARLYQRRQRHAEAQSALTAARAIVDELAEEIPDPELRASYRQQAAALMPRQAAPTARQAAKHAAGGLTSREREVAIMIAQGRSNREISSALVLSERTTKAHVGNILGKLGLRSRTQIAAWAIELGLLKELSAE